MDEKSKEDRQMSRMLFQLAKVVKRICGYKMRADTWILRDIGWFTVEAVEANLVESKNNFFKKWVTA